jgi:uncharacterized protein YkwD
MNSTIVMALVVLINASRADVSMPPLREDPALSARAQVRAETMCGAQKLSHDGYLRAFDGLGHGWKGENLAMAYKDPLSIHTQLMGSAYHRENILRREFTAVGIGHACNITVELFGGTVQGR